MNKEEQRERLYQELLSKNNYNLEAIRKYCKKIARKRVKDQPLFLLKQSNSKQSFRQNNSRDSISRVEGTSFNKLSQRKSQASSNMITKTEPTTHHQEESHHQRLVGRKMTDQSRFATESVRKANPASRQSIKMVKQKKVEKKNGHNQNPKTLLNLKEIIFVAGHSKRKQKNKGRNSSCENMPLISPSAQQQRYRCVNVANQIKQSLKNDFKDPELRNFLPSIRRIRQLRMNNGSSILVKEDKDQDIPKQSFLIESLPIHQAKWNSRQHY